MRRTALNATLLVLLLLLVGANWGLRNGQGRRGVEVFPNMVDSLAAEPYTASPVFADGAAHRPPPAGTIPVGYPPLHYAATPEDAKRAGRELASPLSSSPGAGDTAALARGATVYRDFCQTCHGAKGLGDGPVAQRGFPAPPSLLAPNALAMADGQMFHVLTYGQGNMPSYAAQLDRADRWQAILHVRELQKAAPPAGQAGQPGQALPEDTK
jgi:mono/diheme cytochrome c family protein